ncbi:MAG: lactate utilization protein [Thermoprotei archaeon]|nr:MAG: lactate utilization protein [Thermoprotei archaeon]
MWRDVKEWYWREVIRGTAEALRRNGFEVHVANDRAEAREVVLKLIPPGSTVGVGGSITIRELGLIEELSARGFEVVHHWVKAPPEAVDELRRKELTADVFLCSVNAVTRDGKLLSIDGVGNRVAAMIFGPRRVIVVAGRNKIVRDLDEAMWRARNVAAPMNCRRLGLDTPCAKTGYCTECTSPTRACRIVVVLEARPLKTDFHVVLVNEELGF